MTELRELYRGQRIVRGEWCSDGSRDVVLEDGSVWCIPPDHIGSFERKEIRQRPESQPPKMTPELRKLLRLSPPAPAPVREVHGFPAFLADWHPILAFLDGFRSGWAAVGRRLPS